MSAAADYAREYHARRMATDPEYRERRKQYAATQNAKRKAARDADDDLRATYLEVERARHAVRQSDPVYRENKRLRSARNSRRRTSENPTLVRTEKRRAQASRRARKASQFVESVDPNVVYQMHGGMCGICRQFLGEEAFHVDHVIPLSKGGPHAYANCQPAHPTCNIRKGNRVPA